VVVRSVLERFLTRVSVAFLSGAAFCMGIGFTLAHRPEGQLAAVLHRSDPDPATSVELVAELSLDYIASGGTFVILAATTYTSSRIVARVFARELDE